MSAAGKPDPFPEWKAADLKNRRVPRNVDFSKTGFRRIAGQLSHEFRRLAGLGELFESAEYDLVRIQRAWSKIAGPLAAFSYPKRLKEQGTTLEVIVENAVYSQEVSLYKSEILKACKFAGFSVNALYTKVGSIPWDKISGGRPGSEKESQAADAPANPGLDGLIDGLLPPSR